MTVPYAKILMSVNGGPFLPGARVVPAGATIALKGESTNGWNDGCSWEIFSSPPNNDGTTWAGPAASGWSYDATKQAWVSTDIQPSAFVLAGSSTVWGKWLLRLIVNRGIDPTTRQGPQTDPAGNLLPNGVIDISGGWEVLSPKASLVDVAPKEGQQFDALSYVRELQLTLRKIDAKLGAGGDPTGYFALTPPFTTQNTNFTVAGTIPFDPTQLSATSAIKLHVVLETTSPAVTLQLYNATTHAVVAGSTITLPAATVGPTEFTTADLTSALSANDAVYQVQIKMAAGGASDMATLHYARLETTRAS